MENFEKTPSASLFNILFALNKNQQNAKLVDGETIFIMDPKYSSKPREIILEDVRQAERKVEEKAIELASNCCLTAGSIRFPLSIQAPVFNKEF
ncbi:LOW QUALITY PROTEIN: hypothetical protein HZS_3453 [Henneguya salminicola]|nr:LOW QUALITY PROTEIN: hypothetical protein HZS_3453 [Henneguya salminicola]